MEVIFGPGMGIMTLALLSLLGLTDLNKMNALKTLATGLINVSAVIVFVSNGAIFFCVQRSSWQCAPLLAVILVWIWRARLTRNMFAG